MKAIIEEAKKTRTWREMGEPKNVETAYRLLREVNLENIFSNADEKKSKSKDVRIIMDNFGNELL